VETVERVYRRPELGRSIQDRWVEGVDAVAVRGIKRVLTCAQGVCSVMEEMMNEGMVMNKVDGYGCGWDEWKLRMDGRMEVWVVERAK